MIIKEYVTDIIQLSKSKLAKDSATVLTGQIFSAGIGFAATILITRTLGPAQFGLFAIALAVMGIASQLSDFGINTGLVRFASLYLKTDRVKANLMFKVSLKLKLVIAASIFLIGFFSSQSMAIHIFGRPELTYPLKLCFIGTFGTSLFAYILATLQARQSFKKFTFFSLIQPIVKLTSIGLLFLTYKLNLLSSLTTIIILPFIAVIIGSLLIPKDFLKTKGDEKRTLSELFHFSKWIMVSTFCVMIFTRLDVLMLGYFKSAEIVGYYSAAYQLSFAVSLVTGSLITILLPKASSLVGKNAIKKYVKNTFKYGCLFVLVLVPLILLSQSIILTTYGSQYEEAIPIFSMLFAIRLLGVIISPLGLIFYTINKPWLGAYLNIFQLIGNIIGNYLMIPPYGAIGAALATLIVYALGGLFIGTYIYSKIFRSSGDKL